MALKRKEDTRYYFQPREEAYEPERYEAYPEKIYPEEYPLEDYYPENEFATQAYQPEGGYLADYPPEDVYLEDYPPEDDYNIDMDPDDLDLLDDDSYREEKKLRRIGRFRVAAGVMDFLGVIGGMVAVLVLVALLISLVNWLYADILNTFTILQTRL
ncbi:MAG: hypothetical protein IJ461_09275 [Clostridia bacterium]|nr:hypothetical protein [Clostridia bacterium]